VAHGQNRQDTKGRIRGELDFDVNRRAESEIQVVANKLNTLGDRPGDIEDLRREKLIPAQAAAPSSVQ
jgi:CRP/FNR family cyclic AMP-dependent transcriptional regulator